MKKYWLLFLDFFSDREDPAEPHFDPVHFGAMIVLTLFAMTALFWLLWALLVFGGGIHAKLVPLARVVFTPAAAADFGYEGYPYAMGVFEGWPTNAAALVILAGLIAALRYVFTAGPYSRKK